MASIETLLAAIAADKQLDLTDEQLVEYYKEAFDLEKKLVEEGKLKALKDSEAEEPEEEGLEPEVRLPKAKKAPRLTKAQQMMKELLELQLEIQQAENQKKETQP